MYFLFLLEPTLYFLSLSDSTVVLSQSDTHSTLQWLFLLSLLVYFSLSLRYMYLLFLLDIIAIPIVLHWFLPLFLFPPFPSLYFFFLVSSLLFLYLFPLRNVLRSVFLIHVPY
jgi:hypothetical protein